MPDMRIALAFLAGVSALAILQLSVVPFADVGLCAVILLSFFRSARTAAWFGLAYGVVLDVFSPVFGVHLLVYPLCAAAAGRISGSTFTDRSLLALELLGAIILVAVSFVKSGIFFALAKAGIGGGYAISLGSIFAALIPFAGAVAFQAAVFAAAYLGISRRRASDSFALT